MSHRQEKKYLRRKIFEVMQSIDYCFDGLGAFGTPTIKIGYKSSFGKSNKFWPTESYKILETQVHNFLKNVEINNSADGFNRAVYGWNSDFSGWDTGCIDMLTYYLERLAVVELRG